MVALRIDVRRGLAELTRGFDALQQRQLPFATAQALNAVAARAATAEGAQIEEILGPVTAFTKRAMAVRRATKSRPTATIFVKDIQANYLAPYMPGGSGSQVLRARGILQPIDLRTNRFGNIPRGKLEQLRARADIFIGPVRTRAGTVNGVWRRLPASAAKGKGTVGRVDGKTRRLELLIRFEDPKSVRPRLAYGEPTALTVRRYMPIELERAMRQALASAR